LIPGGIVKKILIATMVLLSWLCLSTSALAQTKEIRVLLANHPYGDLLKGAIPDFEKATGIRVNVEQLQESQLSTKLATEFATRSSTVDVFMTRPLQEAKMFQKNDWNEPLTMDFTDYPKNFDLRKDYTEAHLLKIVESIPLSYTPGTKWSYSNLGYLTLGILIHKVTGEFYGDFLQEKIFHPLGMTTTRIISEADIIPNRAAGYRLVKGELKNQEWVSPTLNTTADGSLYFSILDLAKWDAALYTEKLLKRSSLEQMWTVAKYSNGQPNSDQYGFAWFVRKKNGHHVVEHEGSWQGFETVISRYVDDKLTVVVLDNLAESKPGVIADKIAEMYLTGKVK